MTHPDAWRACVEAPESQAGAVQELLRWNPPVAAQPRFSRPDRATRFEGTLLPPSSSVLFGIAAANRQPHVYPCP